MDKEGLRRQNGIHCRVELWKNDIQHLVDVRWVEKALSSLGDIQIRGCKIDSVSSKFCRMGEELIVQGVIERTPWHSEVVDGQRTITVVSKAGRGTYLNSPIRSLERSSMKEVLRPGMTAMSNR